MYADNTTLCFNLKDFNYVTINDDMSPYLNTTLKGCMSMHFQFLLNIEKLAFYFNRLCVY